MAVPFRRWWLAFGLAVLVGCSDGPPPLATAKKVVDRTADKPIDFPQERPPEKSDPASAAVLTAAIAAHTDGHPERLDKLKSVTVTRSGLLQLSTPPSKIKWQFRAVWPDRFRLDDLTDPLTPAVVCRAGTTAWQGARSDRGLMKQILTGPQARGPIADGTYEWLSILTPLTDPQLIVSPVAERTVNGRPAVGVRLTGPALPNALVHFDKETKQLAQFSYEGSEAESPVVKEVIVLELRAVNGVVLPHKLSIKWNGRPAVEWTVDSLEFPVDHPAKLFEEP